MIARFLVFAAIVAAPVAAAVAQSPSSYRITPRQALPPQPSNIAGTTPQRIERAPSLRERAARLRERIRARRSR